MRDGAAVAVLVGQKVWGQSAVVHLSELELAKGWSGGFVFSVYGLWFMYCCVCCDWIWNLTNNQVNVIDRLFKPTILGM